MNNELIKLVRELCDSYNKLGKSNSKEFLNHSTIIWDRVEKLEQLLNQEEQPKEIDFNRKLKLRNGAPYFLHTLDEEIAYGVYYNKTNDEIIAVRNWRKDGGVCQSETNYNLDLVYADLPVKKKLTGFVNVYKKLNGNAIWETKTQADYASGPERIAVIDLSQYNIEYTEEQK